jgi:hypothetical protein
VFSHTGVNYLGLGFGFGFGLNQGLTMQPRLSLNSQSSCLGLLSAGMTAICHHVQLEIAGFVKTLQLRLL